MREKLTSPPVIGAMISSTVAVLLALVPALLSSNNQSAPMPTAAPTRIVQAMDATPTTAPQDPATALPLAAPPTETIAAPSATPVPATATPLAQAAAPQANVTLLYDDVSFTMHNQSGTRLAVETLSFQSAAGRWDAIGWGEGLASDFPANHCLRLRDLASGQRQPPASCGTLWGFQLVGESALFWLEVAEFEVWRDGTRLATCTTAAGRCGIFVA